MSTVVKRQFTFASEPTPSQAKSAFTLFEDENPRSPGDFGQLIKSTPFKTIASPPKMVVSDSRASTVNSSQASQVDSVNSQSSQTDPSKKPDKTHCRKTSIINHFLNDLTENHEEIRRK